jgi:hypothetical protein
MASNRFSTDKRPPTQPTQALAALGRQGAELQLAALLTAGKFIAGWARAADRFAHAVGDELLRRADGETDSRGLIVGLSAAAGNHLDELAGLPHAAAEHFDARRSRVPTDT